MSGTRDTVLRQAYLSYLSNHRQTGLIRFFLECVENDTPKFLRFLDLLVEYTRAVNTNAERLHQEGHDDQ